MGGSVDVLTPGDWKIPEMQTFIRTILVNNTEHSVAKSVVKRSEYHNTA